MYAYVFPLLSNVTANIPRTAHCLCLPWLAICCSWRHCRRLLSKHHSSQHAYLRIANFAGTVCAAHKQGWRTRRHPHSRITDARDRSQNQAASGRRTQPESSKNTIWQLVAYTSMQICTYIFIHLCTYLHWFDLLIDLLIDPVIHSFLNSLID